MYNSSSAEAELFCMNSADIGNILLLPFRTHLEQYYNIPIPVCRQPVMFVKNRTG